MKIAILYVCTGKYICFWEGFYKSFEQNFIKEAEKHYFVFTDADDIYDEDRNEKIHVIHQENLGWPGNTLFRFEMFHKIEDRLQGFEYTFFMNSNVLCVDKITAEEFLPEENMLLVVQHPGFYSKKPYEFTYDRNPKSRAYVPYTKGKYYVCGGVNGGGTKRFIKAINELRDRTSDDWKKRIIALWHDESQLNRYIIGYTDYRILTPSYCYPEGWNIPYKSKLIVRDKSKYFDVDMIKSVNDPTGEVSKFEALAGKIDYKFAVILYKIRTLFCKLRKRFE